MARTRNFDPGRAAALHYASQWHRHAKRLVYAYLCAWVTAGQGLPAAFAAGQEPPVPCVSCQALSIAPEQIAILPGILNGTSVLIRIAPEMPSARWADALAEVKRIGGTAGLHLTAIPAEDAATLAAVVDRLLVDAAGDDLDRLAFDLKKALAAARGKHPNAALFVAATPAVAAALRERGLAPYLTRFVDPAAVIGTPDALIDGAAGPFVPRILPRAATEASAIAAAAAALQSWLPEGLAGVRDRSLTCGEDRRVPAFLNPKTLDLVGVTRACPRPATVTSDMPGASVERYDLGSSSAFLVHAGSDTRFAEGVDVAGSRSLTVEEIIARHQAAAARQAASIATDMAGGTMTLTFEAPGFVAPVTVTSEMTMFEDRRPRAEGRAPNLEVRQARIRVNGVGFDAKGGVPHLPILEPERVAAPPLAIALSEVYRYRLAGRERIRGRDAYVVAFSPRRSGESLFDGRAWIDAQTFGMIRVSASQTSLKGAITASEQTDDFDVDAGGRWLLTRSDVRQTYEGASMRTPIHRLVSIARHDINRDDFTAQLAAAHASDEVMLRVTPDGFRYLAREKKREPANRAPVNNGEPGNLDPGNLPARVLSGRSEKIRTIAFGTIIDPNISVPLPFAGLSYVDFNFFGTGAQFSGFYGGSYGQLAFSAPSVAGTRWQLAARAFGIASSYNDRAFEDGREIYEQDIRQRPAQAAVWALRPLSARTAFRFQYDWDYNKYDRGDLTAARFAVPRNQNAHGVRLAFEAQRAGWQMSVWGSYARRVGWRAWGLPESPAYRETHADFQRFGASALRSQAITPRIVTRVEVAAMGGRDLDRFSRYAFGTFDNRLHGYPSALIRYDRGAVLRTALAWSMAKAIRIDGFADTAAVRDPGFGPTLRQYTGLGAALEAPGPFRTLLSLEWGYGFQGIDTDGDRGTHVLRLAGYKVF